MTRLVALYAKEHIAVYHLRDERAVPSTYAMCERDSEFTVIEPEAKVAFAMDPTGPITCLRCLTMASRGIR